MGQALLQAAEDNPETTVAATHDVGADLDALIPAVICDVELAAGSYRIAVEGRGSITVAVLDERTRNIVGRAVGSADFSVPEHTRVVITTTMAWGSTARVRQLVLTPSNP